MEDTTSPPARAPHPRWFWINVGILAVLAPWATYWFQQHLKLYFTGIVVIGGAFSIWVLLQAMWAMVRKTAQVDAWEHSRKLLALPDVTVVLVTAAVVLLVLWRFTASLYITYQGAAGEGEYLVDVVRQPESSPMIPPSPLTAGSAVLGRPFFWQMEPARLVCRILRPARYEALPCDLKPGSPTRVLVPESFTPREFHLLRIVPADRLYPQLPTVYDMPVSRYELEIEAGGQKQVLSDMRRQTIYTGAGEDEMPMVLALEQPGALESYLKSSLIARANDEQAVEKMTALLSMAPRIWPALYLRSGDMVSLSVSVTNQDGERKVLDGFPVQYQVNAGKVQTIWLPR
jgi:hypothetical protein